MCVWNVRALPKKLSHILTLPFSCFVLSEVRVPASSFRSLARVSSSFGFSSCFSPAPPPFPTFACSPGGTAILARHEFVLQEEHIPALAKWRALGRVTAASIRGHSRERCSILACYGLPPSHPQRGSNEVLLSDVLAFLSGLKCPSIVAGALNDSHITSAALSMCAAIGVRNLTPNLPTTMKKDGQVSKSPPIDHASVNKAALDLFGKVRIEVHISLHL